MAIDRLPERGELRADPVNIDRREGFLLSERRRHEEFILQAARREWLVVGDGGRRVSATRRRG